MTTVTFQKNADGSYRGFVCKGHAGYAKGKQPDIVCAAVSALTISTVNALSDLAKEELECETDDDTGYLKCEIKSNLQEKSVFLMDALVLGLQNISESYGSRYLQVKFKEV